MSTPVACFELVNDEEAQIRKFVDPDGQVSYRFDCNISGSVLFYRLAEDGEKPDYEMPDGSLVVEVTGKCPYMSNFAPDHCICGAELVNGVCREHPLPF